MPTELTTSNPAPPTDKSRITQVKLPPSNSIVPTFTTLSLDMVRCSFTVPAYGERLRKLIRAWRVLRLESAIRTNTDRPVIGQRRFQHSREVDHVFGRNLQAGILNLRFAKLSPTSSTARAWKRSRSDIIPKQRRNSALLSLIWFRISRRSNAVTKGSATRRQATVCQSFSSYIFWLKISGSIMLLARL